MDERQVDCLTRGVARVVDRRTGLRGLLALGAAALAVSLTGSEQSAARNRNGRVTIQGPCGDGSVQANKCNKNADCCTDFCDKSKTPKGAKGRCRQRNSQCIPTGDSGCSEAQDCCDFGQGAGCNQGTCQFL